MRQLRSSACQSGDFTAAADAPTWLGVVTLGGDGVSYVAKLTTCSNDMARSRMCSGNGVAVSQSGNNNAFGIIQFGRNTSTAARQNGNGNVGLVFEGGW